MKLQHPMLLLVAMRECVPAAFLGLAMFMVPAIAVPSGLVPLSQPHLSDLREAVETHRGSQREAMRREKAVAGRRLTAAELVELRDQVRQQWAARSEVVRSAESQPVKRLVSAPDSRAKPVPAPRLQQP